MTARSGDALSHVNFQAGQTSFLTAINCPRSAFDAPTASFDAAFFRMDDAEARATDPQARIFLELAHEALERAGFASY